MARLPRLATIWMALVTGGCCGPLSVRYYDGPCGCVRGPGTVGPPTSHAAVASPPTACNCGPPGGRSAGANPVPTPSLDAASAATAEPPCECDPTAGHGGHRLLGGRLAARLARPGVQHADYLSPPAKFHPVPTRPVFEPLPHYPPLRLLDPPAAGPAAGTSHPAEPTPAIGPK